MAATERRKCIVCGNEIAAEQGIDEIYEGEHRWFCTPEDQARFEADPERYVGETQALVWQLGYC